MSLTSYQAAPPRVFTYVDEDGESKLKKRLSARIILEIQRFGSSGRNSRTYGTASDREAVTHDDAHPDALDLSRLVAAWPLLPATLRSAVLEIVRSFVAEMEGSRP